MSLIINWELRTYDVWLLLNNKPVKIIRKREKLVYSAESNYNWILGQHLYIWLIPGASKQWAQALPKLTIYTWVRPRYKSCQGLSTVG